MRISAYTIELYAYFPIRENSWKTSGHEKQVEIRDLNPYKFSNFIHNSFILNKAANIV